MKAKKSYGQHFLTSDSIAERIADSLSGTGYANILEVGPGMGMLSQYLIKKPKSYYAVEADREMIPILEEKFPDLKGHIMLSDFLKVNLNEFPPEAGSIALIGNYPYNISSQIIFQMLEYMDRIPEMVGMFQKEMAERIVAEPGSKTYGVISVLTQAYYDGKLLFSVKPGSFNPPPKVNSAVIRLVRREVPISDVDNRWFRKVVKQAFSQRRKMLRNTLKGLVEDPSFFLDQEFNERPEQLSVRDFVNLTKRILKQRELESGSTGL
ncbi:MAG: ribosomal RNA small subunit methyltransferase A [Saprospiraceae bacterium]|nr:ribosomal RNA small subunit methyltransferase A [Saprospiraceae bacterium]